MARFKARKAISLGYSKMRCMGRGKGISKYESEYMDTSMM